MQTDTQIPPRLTESSDPILLSDLKGNILWCNHASTLLKNDLKQLRDLLNSETCSEILNAECIYTSEADLSQHFGFSLIFSVLSVFCSNGEPENDFVIVVLKALEFDLKNYTKNENDLSSVAHDLKNPLGAIFGYADALIDSPLSQGLSDKQKEVISRIRSTTVRSIELVKNLQQLSSLKSEDYSFSSKVVDINQIIDAVHKGTWRENPDQPKIILNLSKQALKTKVERILLDRTISNLYSNALKFTPLEGIIKIESSIEGQFVRCSVNNNLPLIDKSEISKIFNNRYRAKNSQGTSGTGLGLYITKEILQKIGGKIEAKSDPESGTTFTAYFPLEMNP